MAANYMDIIGQVFNGSTVLELHSVVRPEGCKSKGYRVVTYKLKCHCGNIFYRRRDRIKLKCFTGCNCTRGSSVRKRLLKHNQCGTPLYNIWASMKERCRNKKNISYKWYGGRGIMVCDEWAKDYLAFYKFSMENGYRKGLTIDRIEVNGNYEPGNCRWITQKVQCDNTSRSIKLEFNGEVKSILEWANGDPKMRTVLYNRIKKSNWSIEKILTTPVMKEYQHTNKKVVGI